MRKKLITAIIALSLVLCCLVGGTAAWLMDTTSTVENTFTYGDINIDLEETVNGVKKSAATTAVTNDKFQMVPGSTLDKDPTVTVEANSEDCYLFVKITESANLDTFITYAIAGGWTILSSKDTTEVVIYRTVAKSTTQDQEFDIIGYNDAVGKFVANKVLVKTTVTKQDMEGIKTSNQPTLTFKAYAVQIANVADVNAAWDLVKGN